MEENKNEEVVEETTQDQVEQKPVEETTPQIDESKFESAGDDSIMKVDLSQPPVSKEVANEEPDTKEEVIEEIIENKVEEPVNEQEEKKK